VRPFCQGDEIFFLLLVIPEKGEHCADDAGVKRQCEPCRCAGPGDFLHDDGMGQKIRAGAPVRLGKGNSHPPPGGEFPEQLGGVATALVDLGGNGIDVLPGKFADVVADEFLFLG